jgi:hypothetical protein
MYSLSTRTATFLLASGALLIEYHLACKSCWKWMTAEPRTADAAQTETVTVWLMWNRSIL